MEYFGTLSRRGGSTNTPSQPNSFHDDHQHPDAVPFTHLHADPHTNANPYGDPDAHSDTDFRSFTNFIAADCDPDEPTFPDPIRHENPLADRHTYHDYTHQNPLANRDSHHSNPHHHPAAVSNSVRKLGSESIKKTIT